MVWAFMYKISGRVRSMYWDLVVQVSGYEFWTHSLNLNPKPRTLNPGHFKGHAKS